MPFPHRKFRNKRDELGLTRAELAERSGLTPRYVEALEQGRKPNPTQDTIEGLCRALGVTCEFFFSADDPGTDEPPARGRPKKAVEPGPPAAGDRPRGGKKGGG